MLLVEVLRTQWTWQNYWRAWEKRYRISSLARFPERFLVSSSSDGFLHRFVGVSTSNGECRLRLVISSSSSSSNDKSKSVTYCKFRQTTLRGLHELYRPTFQVVVYSDNAAQKHLKISFQ